MQGDFGGPVVLKSKKDRRFYQIGMPLSVFSQQKVVYMARISHYIQWIKDTVQNN